jgi:hypothetical protein
VICESRSEDLILRVTGLKGSRDSTLSFSPHNNLEVEDLGAYPVILINPRYANVQFVFPYHPNP